MGVWIRSGTRDCFIRKEHSSPTDFNRSVPPPSSYNGDERMCEPGPTRLLELRKEWEGNWFFKVLRSGRRRVNILEHTV